MLLIAFFSSLLFQLLLFCQKGEAAVTAFVSKPSVPSYAQEGYNITFVWNYTLNGGVGFAKFVNVTGGANDNIVTKFGGGNIDVKAGYQERFRAEISDSQAQLTILTVQRSDKGSYRLDLTDVNGGPLLHDVELIIQFPPDITVISGNKTVNETDNVNLDCGAVGYPAPIINWTRISDNSVVTFPIHNISRQDQGGYRCTANNSVGSPATKDVYIIVQYEPNITHISPNQTVNQNDSVALNCTADSNPAPSIITWTNVSDNSVVTFPLNITGKQDEGFYRCTADNGIGNPGSKDVFIFVQNFSPFDTRLMNDLSDNTTVLNTSFNLTCSAQANPPAKYRFYREQEILYTTPTGNDNAVYTTSATERINQVNYRCTPFNDYGDGPTAVTTVTVHYPPSVIDHNQTISVSEGNSASLICPVDGNPEPNITWYKGNSTNGEVLYRGKKWTLSQTSSSDSGWYSCYANNSLENISARLQLIVDARTTPTTQTTGKPTDAISTFQGTCTITNKDCNDSKDIAEVDQKFLNEIIKKVEHVAGVTRSIISKTGCGNNVIVNFVLWFNQSVSAGDVIAALKTAAQNGQFGNFIVDPDSIKQTSPSPTSSTSPTDKQEPGCTKSSFLENNQCEPHIWAIVGVAVGGAVVIAFIIGIIACWVHKKRKCRKDPRTHCEEAQRLQEAQNGGGENAYSQVNSGYAHSGPPSANGAAAPAAAAPAQQQQQQGAAASPDVAEQNIPQYAVVNKKKKKVVEDTYAQVDMSKKSKKKPKAKPGEVLYADLGDFQRPKDMPAVSTSPQPLPPIIRHEAYQETQYADITQFLKGDATLPASNNSQGTEMKSIPANMAEDGGTDKVTESQDSGKTSTPAIAGENKERKGTKSQDSVKASTHGNAGEDKQRKGTKSQDSVKASSTHPNAGEDKQRKNTKSQDSVKASTHANAGENKEREVTKM